MRFVLVSGMDATEVGARTLTLGSDAGCDLQMATAAPLHARVTPDGILTALAPCTVGKVSLDANDRRQLLPNCKIEIAGTALVFAEDDAPASIPTRELALRMLATSPTVVVVQGPNAGKDCLLSEQCRIIVGRAETADLRLQEDPGISREHLELTMLDGVVLVRDLQTTHGTYLGDSPLESHRKAVWEPGLMLRLSDETVLGIRLPELFHEKARAIIREHRKEPSSSERLVVAPPLPTPPEQVEEEQPSAEELAAPESAPVSSLVQNAGAASTAAVADVALGEAGDASPQLRTGRLDRLIPIGAGLAIVMCLVLLFWVLR